MLSKIISHDNIATALEYLAQKNPEGFGIDGMPLAQLPEYVQNNYELLKAQLLEGHYDPQPVILRDFLTKSGRLRAIALFCSVDRLILRAIHQVIEPVLVPHFCNHSFAYRDHTGVLDAVQLAAQYAGSGELWCTEVDIRKYFDNIPHDRLLIKLQKYIPDPKLLELIAKYLKCATVKDGEFCTNHIGVIQGSAIGPLLANLYLHDADCYCEARQWHYIRFADDIKLFSKTFEQGQAMMQEFRTFLEKEQLPVAAEKCGVFPVLGHRILGYRLTETGHGIQIERITRQRFTQHTNWRTSALEPRGTAYHLIGNGILTKKDFALLFENDTLKTDLPVECTHSINVYADVVMGSGIFRFANKNNLTINFFDQYGVFQGCFLPEMPCQMEAAFAQMAAYQQPEHRLALAKQIICAGIHNFRANIRYYGKRSGLLVFRDALQQLTKIENEIERECDVEGVRLREANARKLYFGVYNQMLPADDFTFTVRSRRPPRDAINAMISFGNMYLYNEIARQIYQSPLDIRIGFLHSSGRRSRSLNLDLAEIFKPIIVDRVIFSLINRHLISEERHFSSDEQGAVLLNHEGKQIMLKALKRKMEQTVTLDEKTFSYAALIKNEIYKMVRHFISGTGYKAYRYY